MVERDIPKRSETSFLGMPRSMAESTFNLRSFEYAFMDLFHVGPLLTQTAVSCAHSAAGRAHKEDHAAGLERVGVEAGVVQQAA